ncbi:MAG: PAS domain-containing protein, partial [Desulfobacula sp.]
MHNPEETNSNYRVFFDSAPSFLWILNHHGEILDANSSLTAILGYSRDELIGKPIASLYPDTHQEDIHHQIQTLNRNNYIFYESPIMAVTGLLIPVETIMIRGFWNSEPAFFGYCRSTIAKNTDEGEASFLPSGAALDPGQEKYLSMASLAIKKLEATRKELDSCKEKSTQLTNEYSVKMDREIQERKYIEKEISKKNILLAEKNITLKQLLDQREKEKQEIRDEIYKKVQSLILPLIGRIQANGTDVDKRYLQAVLHNLQGIISPLSSE